MLICFMCDLHLSYNKRTVQYDALDWACSDLKNKRADAVVFAGDFTADGNIFAAKRFVRKIQSLTVPCIVIPGNSDCRTPKNISYMQSLCSPCENILSEKIKIFAVNDSEKIIDLSTFETLEKADENSIVVMHHPSGSLEESSKKRFEDWRKRHQKSLLVYGHLHKSSFAENSLSLPALDPDKSIGENPSIVYYDTESGEITKSCYFCPVPGDIYDYIGISCFDVPQDINYAEKEGLKCIELRYNALGTDAGTLHDSIAAWRKSGGVNLSMHAPEMVYSSGNIENQADWDKFTMTASSLGADRITVHVPKISIDTVKKDKAAFDNISDFLAKRFALLPAKCVIGVENMHMTEIERTGQAESRRFGYLPEECVEFMKHLRKKCTRVIGINLDVGHARNNAPFSQKYPISTWYAETGRYSVGYHIHQTVKDEQSDKMLNHMPITDVYGSLISYASFFKCWSTGAISKAPVILEIRGHGEYKASVELFKKYRSRCVFDLHMHTNFSSCGKDRPEKIILSAVENGIKLIGISDHCYDVSQKQDSYIKKIRDLAGKYSEQIKVLCAVEIATKKTLFEMQDLSKLSEYDYCLVEHITDEESVVGGNLLEFCEKIGTRCVIAHTDLFRYCEKYGYDAHEYFKHLAQKGIIWEMNVCCDKVHFYREHQYVKDFMSDTAKQNVVKEAGMFISVGSDCHTAEEYRACKVHDMYDFLKAENINTADLLFM